MFDRAAVPGSQAKSTPPIKQISEFMKTAAKLKDAKPDQIFAVRSMLNLAQSVSGNQPSLSSLTITMLAQATGSAEGFVICSNPADPGELKATLASRRTLQLLPHRENLLPEIGDHLVKSCPQNVRQLFLIKDSSTLDSRKLKKYCKDRGVTLHILVLPPEATEELHPLHQLQTPNYEGSKMGQRKKKAHGRGKAVLSPDLLDHVLAPYSRQNIKRAFGKTLGFLRDTERLSKLGKRCLHGGKWW